MSKRIVVVLMLSLVLVLLAACGGGGPSETETAATEAVLVGDPANGASLFSQPVIGDSNAPGCITCHSLQEDVVIVGPSQAGLGTRAETRVPGQSAEEYIRNSIIHPDEYIVEGFPAGVMYPNYEEDLTQEQIDDIVAYTLTLR
ncbi:MAG: c-type cytochrome [Chloroflexota bacterium]|jgi:mono/diheme cytochrome c family protein